MLPGFESSDVLVTADFIENINDLFDVLNSRSRYAAGFKKAITVENFERRQPLFENVRDMIGNLTVTWKVYNPGQKIHVIHAGKLIHSPRRTGFLGLAGATYVIEHIVYSWMKRFPVSFPKHLRTYKMNQDHLEMYFNAIRSQNGWSYNPTGIQVRWAFKKLITYAGNGILASASANCIPQDGTSILKIDLTKATRAETPDISNVMREHGYGSSFDVDLQMHSCKLPHCEFCRGILAYIAGSVANSVEKMIKCEECIFALKNSVCDPCNDLSLITMKQYGVSIDFETTRKGLTEPSGSVFKLLMLGEDVLRKHKRLITDKNAIQKLFQLSSREARFFHSDFFPTLKRHFIATQDGIDSHYFALSKLILQNFFKARVDKILKDAKNGEASRLHRLSILCDKNKAQKNKSQATALIQQRRQNNVAALTIHTDVDFDNEIEIN